MASDVFQKEIQSNIRVSFWNEFRVFDEVSILYQLEPTQPNKQTEKEKRKKKKNRKTNLYN